MFFLTGVKEKCIYALCVGLTEDNTIPTKPLYIQTTKSHTRKARSYKPKSPEWNNAAIKVKKEERKEEKIPTISHSQHRALSIQILISTERKERKKEGRKKRNKNI